MTPAERKTGSVVSKKERDSNLELFRILVMLLIVAHHYVVNSGLLGGSSAPINANLTSWRSIFLLLIGMWGKTGINCFMLITGYFMCKSRITPKKFAKLLLEIYFYRIAILGVFLIAGKATVTSATILKLIMPISTISGLFTDCYVVFFLCIPFLNILVQNMTEKQHLRLLCLLGIVFVGFGTLPFFKLVFNYTTWFCVLYVISSYFRLYPKKIYDNTRLLGLIALANLLLACASIVVCAWLNEKFYPGRFMADWFVSDCNKILAVSLSISSFLFFRSLKIKHSSFINAVASTTYGVLLIHTHGPMMPAFLWQETLYVVGAYSSKNLVLHAIASVFGVFAVCSAIDYLRIRFLERPFFAKCWDRIEQKCLSFRKGA